MLSATAYGKIEEELKSIYRSRLQTQILLSLGKGKKTLSQLREITGSTSQALIPKIRKLEANQLVDMEGYSYRLTPIGKILTAKMQDSISAFGAISKFKNFLSNHHLEGIPEPLLKDIGELYNAEIIRDTSEDVNKVFSNYFRYLREAKQLFVVSSMTSPELIDAVIERLAQGIPVEVVITSEVFEKVDKEPYIEKYYEMIQFSNLKLMVTEEYVRVGFTVTEKFLSMGLYKKDGMLYDMSEELFSFDKTAIEWGQKFYQYYKDRSVMIALPPNK